MSDDLQTKTFIEISFLWYWKGDIFNIKGIKYAILEMQWMYKRNINTQKSSNINFEPKKWFTWMSIKNFIRVTYSIWYFL